MNKDILPSMKIKLLNPIITYDELDWKNIYIKKM